MTHTFKIQIVKSCLKMLVKFPSQLYHQHKQKDLRNACLIENPHFVKLCGPYSLVSVGGVVLTIASPLSQTTIGTAVPYKELRICNLEFSAKYNFDNLLVQLQSKVSM